MGTSDEVTPAEDLRWKLHSFSQKELVVAWLRHGLARHGGHHALESIS